MRTRSIPAGLARLPRAALRRCRSIGRVLLRGWRSSLRVRIVTSTLVIGLVTMFALGVYLTDSIRDGLFNERLREALDEAARSTQAAQLSFDSATVSNASETQQLANDTVNSLRRVGSVDREVLLLRSPGDSVVSINEMVSDPAYKSVISPALRTQVESDGAQHWQSVKLPDGEPGLAIGSEVALPAGVGDFELYFVYNLEPEQKTLALIERVLAAGAAGMVIVLVGMTFLVTRQVVTPVRAAAGVAERLASGLLSERMPVRGEDELATLARSFNEMADSLQDQIEQMEQLSLMQRRFVSDVSHELRTPLTTIRMASEILHSHKGDYPPDVARSAELLIIQLDRFDVLLADLLEISRFDAGAAVLDVEECDVRELVTRVVDLSVPLAEDKNVGVRQHLPAEPCTADVDARRIERVVRNLLVNAIEHSEGRPVDVYVGMSATAVAVVVRDHGIGMSDEEVEHVFDRFWRADPARSRTTGGTGLGLAISVEDAHLHGGRLEAWGRLGQGASFRLTLPRRAGMDASTSPLDLVPAGGQDESWKSARDERTDPAKVPELDEVEAE